MSDKTNFEDCPFCGVDPVNEDHKDDCYTVLLSESVYAEAVNGESPITKEQFQKAWNTRRSVKIREPSMIVGVLDIEKLKESIQELQTLINKEQ